MNIGSDVSQADELTRTAALEPSSGCFAGDILLDRPGFQIRVAQDGFLAESAVLVDRRYAWRGYKLGDAKPTAICPELTLQAYQGRRVFGTLTLRVDAECGLAADALFHEELEAYRRNGRRVGELTRLAIEPELGSKELLGALFHMAYVYLGPTSAVDDVFIEVHPRHVPFYRRMLGFKPAGPCRHSQRVDAPAVLLHVEVCHVGQQAARSRGRGTEDLRSLYPYFCSAQEEASAIELMAGSAPVCASPHLALEPEGTPYLAACLRPEAALPLAA
jgi:hypothetical protein